ncbi:MAG: response regulator [Thermodesulfobacteriota bacterium]
MEKRKILVIDDEQIVLSSVKKILTEAGYDVDTHIRPGGGIYLAVYKDYDMVLTDLRMPDVEGLTVLRDIKRHKPDMPVIIITGYASVDSVVTAMKLGATDYLEKPFTPEQLVEKVEKGFEKAKAAPREEQTIVNRKEVQKILKKGASEPDFAHRLFTEGPSTLSRYNLTAAEKLAILTADVQWIEDQLGTLPPEQKLWLEKRAANGKAKAL